MAPHENHFGDGGSDGNGVANGKPFEQEWGTFLNEVRTILPGVQVLFGFLLTVPFASRYTVMDRVSQGVFFGCFLCTAASSAFLMAPAAYHRLHWRRDVIDKEKMFATCNILAIIGSVLLALAMSAAVFVLSRFIVDVVWGALVTGALTGLFAWLWFGLPLRRKQAARRIQRTDPKR